MKVAITGASGYIGAEVLNYLREKAVDCIPASRSLHNLDVFNLENPFEALQKPDVLIHLAWEHGFIHSHESHILNLPKHYQFIKKMLQGGLKQIICLGTFHEIGFFEGKIDEKTPCNPLSYYGISKNSLREIVKILCEEHNSIFQWVRVPYITGLDEKSNSVFAKVLKMEKEGVESFPFVSGENKYDFIDIFELAKQISSIALQKEVLGIINACSGTPVSLKEKLEEFIKIKNLKIKPRYGEYPARKYDSKIIYGCTKKIELVLKNL
jgi:nucleoside-diphosphate-sugar epimerase